MKTRECAGYYSIILRMLRRGGSQSTARDLLAEAMWRMEKAGLAIVGHVHDEVILEVPTGSATVEDVTRIMNENPSWAEGLCSIRGEIL